MDNAVARLRRLNTPLVSDALDALGVRDRALDPGLVSLGQTDQMAGRAATVDVVAVDEVPDPPYVVLFDAIDALRPGEVMVVGAPIVASAFWGELITTRAGMRGCVGALVDGYCRDLARVRTHDFGVWARGTHPADSAGRLDAVAYNVPVTCAGVRVEPGDYVLADIDGVVVVPATLIEDVLTAAEEKAAVEDTVREELLAGRSIVNTYAEYKVM